MSTTELALYACLVKCWFLRPSFLAIRRAREEFLAEAARLQATALRGPLLLVGR
jgi:hypothetical protein